MAGQANLRYADVVVIGSGAGGSTLANKLALSGVGVLLIEAGGHLNTARKASDPVGAYLRHVCADRSKPITCVGGQTKFFGAALYRLRAADFIGREHETGRSEDWPFGYDVLDPYYGEAEALYRVHGAASLDATEPPRQSQLPFPAIPYSGVIRSVVERLAGTGTDVSPIPLALDYRGGQGSCRPCGTCDAHHCRVDAKMDAEIAAVRPAVATGKLTLVTHATCLKVLTSRDGRRVLGVLVDHGSDRRIIHCATVVVAGGVPRSAELLRRSSNNAHPEGLGNNGGALGRYVGGHATGLFFPLIDSTALKAVQTKSFAINDYYHCAPDWPYPLGVIQTVGQMPLWGEAPAGCRSLTRLLVQRALTCCHMTEAIARRETGFRFQGDVAGGWTAPTAGRQTWKHMRKLATGVFRTAGYRSIAPPLKPQLWHLVGGVRMGDDPQTSVVDANLEVHGVSGLFVVDASVLPSAGAVNTSLTIMALALRCADRIAGSFSVTRRTLAPDAR